MDTLETKKYKYIKNILSLDIVDFLSTWSFKNFTKGDEQSPFSSSHHSIESDMFKHIIHYLLPIMEKETNLKLKPIYAYDRIYMGGSELKKHVDRNACEISASITLKYFYKDKNYIFGNFDKIVIAIQYVNDDSSLEDFLIEINKNFIQNFETILEDYAINNIPEFKPFINVIKEILPKYQKTSLEELKLSENVSIIKALERSSYPEGISDYIRDEVLWEEARMVKDEFPADFLEGLLFHLQIYMRISINHIYKIFVDFSDYPSRPTLGFSEDLNKEINRKLGKSTDELLYFYKNWDSITPPHIIEIIKELEAVLLQIHSKGELSESGHITLPDLRPLPKILEKSQQEQ